MRVPCHVLLRRENGERFIIDVDAVSYISERAGFVEFVVGGVEEKLRGDMGLRLFEACVARWKEHLYEHD